MSGSFLDLPVELHHIIASYLTVSDLKNMSVSCRCFLRAYNHPLARRTIFHMNDDTRNFGAMRPYFYNNRIDHVTLKALSENYRNSGIDFDFVRNIQLVMYRNVFENEFLELLDSFKDVRFLDFCSSERPFETSRLKTLKTSDYHITIFSNVFRLFSKFQHIIAEIRNDYYSKPQMIFRDIFENNRDTLRQITLRGNLEPEDLAKMLNIKLDLKTLTLEFDRFNYAKYPSVEDLLPHMRSDNLEVTLTIENISVCFVDLFLNITKLTINRGNIGKIHNLIGYKWVFPCLLELKVHDVGPLFLENIRAPKLRKLELLLPIYDTLQKKDVSPWRLSFPNVQEVFITIGEEKSMSHFWMFSAHFFISGFLANFKKLRKLVINHQRVEKDYFDFIELVGRISLLKTKPVSSVPPTIDIYLKVEYYLEYWLFSVQQIRGNLDIFNRIRKHKVVSFENSRTVVFEREGVIINVFVEFV